MLFKKKTTVIESLDKVELCVKVEANGNNVGNCPTNNNMAGCGC